MVVDDLHVLGTGVRPSKTDPILIVYSDAVLPLSISLEGLQSVARDGREILERLGVVDQEQLGPGPPSQLRWAYPAGRLRVDSVEDVLSSPLRNAMAI